MLSSKPNVTAGIAPGPTCEMPGADGAGGLDPAIQQHVMDNTVTIEFKVDDKMEVVASGFFVGGTDGRILATNDHVVKHILDKYPDAQIFVRPCGGDRKGELLEVKVGEREPKEDLALLTSEKPTDYRGLTIAPEGSADLGETVWVSGMGASTYRCVLEKGSIAALELDPIIDLPAEMPPKESVIIVDATIHRGTSGSSVTDAEGRVIGVAFAIPQKPDQLEILHPNGEIEVHRHLEEATGFSLIIKSEKLTPLVERQQEILAKSMANESAEDELSAWFMDVEELPDIADIEVQDLVLDAVPRDTRLRPDALEGLELRSSFIEGNEASIAAGLSPDTGIVPGSSSLVPGILDTTDIIDGDPLDAGLLFG